MLSRALSRRWFLASLPGMASCLASEPDGKGRTFPSIIHRFSDPATEFPILRLTDPSHSSFLPAFFTRSISKHNFVLYSSDFTGRMEAFRMDFKSGQSRQLTDQSELDPSMITLMPDDREFCYFDSNRLMVTHLTNSKSRQIYSVPDGSEHGRGLAVAEDGQYAAIVEKKDSRYRLQLIHVLNGGATTLAEADEEIREPIPRPRRASVLYRRGNAVWLVNYDARQNYRLKLAEGEIGQAMWSPDGRTVLYLHYPPDPHQLHAIREFVPDTNEDRLIAQTSQFVSFAPNADGSVFVGASGSKASPYVLLLVRSVKRELTVADHHSSDPRMVNPMFTPNSQRIFFVSDREGKPTIYTMAVDKLVEETDSP
jgi:oligogalacturonide lyase